jgi:hypothetical protein
MGKGEIVHIETSEIELLRQIIPDNREKRKCVFRKEGKILVKVQRKFNIKRAEGAADPWGAMEREGGIGKSSKKRSAADYTALLII